MDDNSKHCETDQQKLLCKIYDLVTIVEKNQRIKILKENSIKLREYAESLSLLLEKQTTLANERTDNLEKISTEIIEKVVENVSSRLEPFIKMQEIVDLKQKIHDINTDLDISRFAMNVAIKEKEDALNEKNAIMKENQSLVNQKENLEAEMVVLRTKLEKLREQNEKLSREVCKLQCSTLSELNKNIRQHKPVPFFPMSSGVCNVFNRISSLNE